MQLAVPSADLCSASTLYQEGWVPASLDWKEEEEAVGALGGLVCNRIRGCEGDSCCRSLRRGLGWVEKGWAGIRPHPSSWGQLSRGAGTLIPKVSNVTITACQGMLP